MLKKKKAKKRRKEEEEKIPTLHLQKEIEIERPQRVDSSSSSSSPCLADPRSDPCPRLHFSTNVRTIQLFFDFVRSVFSFFEFAKDLWKLCISECQSSCKLIDSDLN